jgi:hypothetical protein
LTDTLQVGRIVTGTIEQGKHLFLAKTVSSLLLSADILIAGNSQKINLVVNENGKLQIENSVAFNHSFRKFQVKPQKESIQRFSTKTAHEAVQADAHCIQLVLDKLLTKDRCIWILYSHPADDFVKKFVSERFSSLKSEQTP